MMMWRKWQWIAALESFAAQWHESFPNMDAALADIQLNIINELLDNCVTWDDIKFPNNWTDLTIFLSSRADIKNEMKEWH